MSKQKWNLGENAGTCVVESRGRYKSFTFDQRDAADKWAQLHGSRVQPKIVGPAKIKTFVVIVFG